MIFFSLSRKASLFSWSLGVLSFNTWIWQAFSDTEVPTVNGMWVNSLEHRSWMASGHVCPRMASHIIPHPVPAQRGPTSAVTATSLGHTHPLFAVLKFLVRCQILGTPSMPHTTTYFYMCLFISSKDQPVRYPTTYLPVEKGMVCLQSRVNFSTWN